MSTAIQEGTVMRKQITKKTRKVSWEAFQKEYLTREDGYRYEWLDGVVEKTKRTMDSSQVYILTNIQTYFEEYKRAKNLDGHLVSEVDTFFVSHHRRPDIAYLTKVQINKAREGERPVPQFLIEVISKNDIINKVNQKMIDYRNAGVQVVWHILPDYKEVHVYRGREMKIFKGEEIVSAKPVLPDFEMSVDSIFA